MGGVIWAKSPSRDGRPPVSLAQHIQDLLHVHRALVQKGLIPQEIHELLHNAILFHDLGKALPCFQILTLGNSGYTPTDFSDNVPHALASFLFIREDDLPIHRVEGKILAAAVAYHHWRDRYDLFLQRRDHPLGQLARKLTRDPAFREQLLQNLWQELKGLVDPAWNEVLSRYLAGGGALYEVAPPPYRLYWEPVRQTLSDEHTRSWILLAGWLQRIDHFASFMEEAGEGVHPGDAFREGGSAEEVQGGIEAELRNRAGGPVDFWQKEILQKIQGKNAVVVAPTGMGKTELGLLWAAHAGRQMIYALPLRVATEQIFTRIRGYTDAEHAGILHGDADLFLEDQRSEEFHEQEAHRILDFSRQLALPYLVATGDQFFPYVLRPPGYERIYAGFPHTALVVDEVQAYDPVAAAMVVKYAEDVTRLGGKVLVMTATLPGFVNKALEARVPEMEACNLFETSPYRERLERLKRHRVAFLVWKSEAEADGRGKGRKKGSRGLQDVAREVVEQAKQGKKVLVVCNTVPRAREMFAALCQGTGGDLPVYLLHSKFTRRYRAVMERRLARLFGYESRGRGRILVATQVVEASLDLDADVLFTEAAPLDALVQRMGRVFRRYRLQGETLWNRASGRPVEDGELPPGEPNVFVLVDEKKLTSGAGHVYDVDLVGMSLALLLDDEELIQEMMRKNKRKAETWAKELRKTLSSPDFGVVDLSEVDKHEKVTRLYASLETYGHRHIREFHDTLAVLDAGYMSDRQKDAHRLFRRIHQVQGVPYNSLEAFEETVRKLFENESVGRPRTYTDFKRKVLSRFVVSAYPDRREEERHDLAERIRSGLAGSLDEKALRRLERWLAGLGVLSGRYDATEGYVREERSSGPSKTATEVW